MNVLDSCGWLSYFTQDSNAEYFAPIIEDCENLLVPGIVVYEVCRRLLALYDKEKHDLGLRYLKKGRFVAMNLDVFVTAAAVSKQYQLHMADAIIWQTAQAHGATLYTQYAGLEGLPNVKFKAKSPLKVNHESARI